jgi:hypothetical protein
MRSLSEEGRWTARKVARERVRGLLEVLVLFGVATLLIGIMIVCIRMGRIVKAPGEHGVETAMGMMGEMGLGPRV